MVQGRELSGADIATMSGRVYEVALDGLALSGVSSVVPGRTQNVEIRTQNVEVGNAEAPVITPSPVSRPSFPYSYFSVLRSAFYVLSSVSFPGSFVSKRTTRSAG